MKDIRYFENREEENPVKEITNRLFDINKRLINMIERAALYHGLFTGLIVSLALCFSMYLVFVYMPTAELANVWLMGGLDLLYIYIALKSVNNFRWFIRSTYTV